MTEENLQLDREGGKPQNAIPRILVWAPMKDGQPYIAMFAKLPMIFDAPTAVGASKAARAWWTEEKIEKPKRAAAKQGKG